MVPGARWSRALIEETRWQSIEISRTRGLGERERRTARLEEAATAFDACLTVMDTTAEWVPRARLRRDEIRAEIARREATK